MGRIATKVDADAVINDYVSSQVSVDDLAKKYHTGKVKIRKILNDSGVDRRKRGGQCKNKVYVVSDYHIEKYVKRDGFHFVAKSKDGDYCTRDYMNNAGCLTSYIRERYGVDVPVLYERREYYKMTGNYWWEQWFDILEVADADVKKCPYCDWETKDVDNTSGAFEVHLLKKHGVGPVEHLSKFPNDTIFFKAFSRASDRKDKLRKDSNHVTCPICGKIFDKLTQSHMQSEHGMAVSEFKEKYPNSALVSHACEEHMKEICKLGNLTVSKDRFVSKGERDLLDNIRSWGIECEANRQILIGKEIDILIPSKMVGIEFDGLQWHTEFFGGKSHGYHLDKTKRCNEEGYALIHVFEDEYYTKREIVLNKIRHLLGLDYNLPKICGRKVTVKEIYSNDANEFLNLFHIQGGYKSSVYLGAFFNDRLVAVMSFKKGGINSTGWELSRFATDSGYIYQGVASKMFTHFIRDYNPTNVVSFADRRWTASETDNMYVKLGFHLASITPPDYRYYNSKVSRYQRVHKMRMSKSVLSKKYGFPMTMTELEMAKSLGYDRIWDCGLFKYVWKRKDEVQ